MTVNTGRTSPHTSSAGAVKSTPVATPSVAVPTPSKPQKAAPSQTVIAEKAREIWRAAGELPGRDQEYWFEAERQLRQA